MESLHCILIVVSARNAGLVAYNKDVVSGLVQEPDGLWRTIDPLKLLRPISIPMVDIEYAVTIEKCRRPACVSFLLAFTATVLLIDHWVNGLGMLNLLVQASDLATSGQGAGLISSRPALQLQISHA